MPYATSYRPGDWNVLDDLSGFKLKHSQTRKIPGGQTGNLLVAKERWEAQHPQDFVRGIVDDQTIPAGEGRPRQQNRFILVGTWVTAFTPRQSHNIPVHDTIGFKLGDKVSIMLDTGDPWYAVVVGVQPQTLVVSPGIPQSVGGMFGDPIQNAVTDLGPAEGTPMLASDPPTEAVVEDLKRDWIFAGV